MKTYRSLIAVFAATALAGLGGTYAQTGPDKMEIGKGKYKFINRNNKKAALQKIIADIKYGRGAAQTVKSTGKFSGKMYEITRVYDETKPKFGADILSLTPQFKGGHSDVIKRFLIGYLEEMFDYNRPDAKLLAQFILYYNGTFQGKIEKFQNDYSEGVAQKLDPAKVGIKKKYTEWPGKSQIVVPLMKSVTNDEKKDVPADELAKETKPVLEEKMTTEKDKKKVVLYKIYLKKMEKFIEKKKEKEQEAIVKILKKKKKKKKELEDYIVNDNALELLAEKEKLEKEIKDLEDKLPELTQNVKNGKIYVLKTTSFDKSHFKNRMYIVNPYNDNSVLESPYNRICSRHYVFFGDYIVVSGHQNNNDEAHYLVRLNMDNLTVDKFGKNPVFWRTPLVVSGKDKNKLYVIEAQGGSYFLARYNKNLVREAITSIPISENSDITIWQKKIYVTGNSNNDKNIQVFNKSDLQLLKTIYTKSP